MSGSVTWAPTTRPWRSSRSARSSTTAPPSRSKQPRCCREQADDVSLRAQHGNRRRVDHAQSTRTHERAHLRRLRRAAPHVPRARHRTWRPRDCHHRRRQGVLHRRRRPRHHRGALFARRGGAPRVHADDVRSGARDSAMPSSGHRRAQRHHGRRGRGDCRGLRHAHRDAVRKDRVPVYESRIGRRRHGGGVAAPSSDRPRPRDRAADDGRLHPRGRGAAHRPLQPDRARWLAAAGGQRTGRAAREGTVARARPDEARHRQRGVDGSGVGARGRSAAAGVADDARRFPRSLRRLRGQAAAEVLVMRIVCVGGGPGGLYFASLMKKANPRNHIRVIERNRPDDTFGFGVVFSDATMAGIAEADSEAYRGIGRHLVHWDDIAVNYRGERITSTGHGFSGMSRHTLLRVLQEQACAAGVDVLFEREVSRLDDFDDADLVVAADGSNSTVRQLLRDRIKTTIDLRPNRFVWLGTTKPFPAFTFYFKHNDHGLWRVHAYQYAPGRSTFIVECRETTWQAAGMDRATEEESAAFLELLFADELDGHRLITNRSIWRQFPTVRAEPWSSGNVVLLGDAAHTAHFSVGSGTRMAMEDAVALRDALAAPADIAAALHVYETRRRPQVESLQRAAQ